MISVIIPYYHGKKYIPQLLHMMKVNAFTLEAECKTGLEVLFVNDSPEEEIVINGEYPFAFSILTNPQNSGIHASRVHGLKASKGEYVLFLDQDDQITNRCLVSQLSHIGKADMVIGNGHDGEPEGGKHLIYTDTKHQFAATDLRCHYYYNNLIRSPGQVLIRKDAIPELWTSRIMKNNGSDDAFLWILMLQNGCKAEINEDVVYEHVYTGSNTSGNDESMLRSQLEVVELLKGKASTMGMWAFQRRAKYYCTSGRGHVIRFLDVGLFRKVYSTLYMKS